MEPLMTSEEVAEYLHVDPVTIRRLINRKELSAYRIGADYRIAAADLESYLQRQRVTALAEKSDFNAVINQFSIWMRKKFQNASGPYQEGSASNREHFDRLTNRARHTLVLAQEEAQKLRHNYIGTEHVLLGLLREEEGIAGLALKNLNILTEQVRKDIELISGPGHDVVSEMQHLTSRAKYAMELAVDEARQMNHHFLGTEHLLLGLVREGEGLAAVIIQKQGIKLEQVRAEVLKLLKPYLPDTSTTPLTNDATQLATGQKQSQTTTICSNCESANLSHFRYCSHCGQKLFETNDQDKAEPEQGA
ncbi:Clp protease N-terminal domain-containing protein [Dictyobacter arantiisoli]|uniref:Clp R domain-containing protein n=1 Tax=Dictyobacter arantiisoli TaxID=2014874 RepID=A0A5A5TCC3_9CHLR|nr:Clp protease N-terminal domain-containing protein [Dictyobacter arantiisoli]GCF08796.1 hypothetical protein KDI_23600 [Dictyobacter arantiisoli]